MHRRILAEKISGCPTQADVSLEVAAMINRGRMDFWFASAFDAVDNIDSSNPLWIYDQLFRAARMHAHTEKSKTVEANLLRWVLDFYEKGLLQDETKSQAVDVIVSALDEGTFTPRVFHLAQVLGVCEMEQPDEYLARSREFDTPEIRVILPPVQATLSQLPTTSVRDVK